MVRISEEQTAPEGNSSEEMTEMSDGVPVTYCRLGIDIEVASDAVTLDIPLGRIARIEALDQSVDLEYLAITSSLISKIENLESNSKLNHLEFYQNRISKIENISHLYNLCVLDLSFNTIRKIEGIEMLVNLKRLYLSGNKITKIEGLETLTNLELLELGSNRIRAIENINNLTNLQELWLGKNKITEMTIPSLPKLTRLSLQSNRLQTWDESVFDNALSLEELYLGNNKLPDPPKSIIKLTSLKWFDMPYNCLESMGSIASLINLAELWLNDNLIEDIEEVRKLQNLQKLETLYLEGNPLKQKLGPSYRQNIISILPWLNQLDALDIKQSSEISRPTRLSDTTVKPILHRR